MFSYFVNGFKKQIPVETNLVTIHSGTSEMNRSRWSNTTSTHNSDHNARNIMWHNLREALRGDKEAQFKMGISYLHGELGLDRNYHRAEKWLDQAASYGHHQAKDELRKALNDLAFS